MNFQVQKKSLIELLKEKQL